jgi:hypothetical protein
MMVMGFKMPLSRPEPEELYTTTSRGAIGYVNEGITLPEAGIER